MFDFNVVFIGTTGSGKTSLIYKFCKWGKPVKSSPSGIFFSGPIIANEIKPKIWDITGLNASSVYITNKDAIYLCLDLTSDDETIINELNAWVELVKNEGISTDKIVLLGTKADKIEDEDGLETKKNMLSQLASKYGCRKDVFITSSNEIKEPSGTTKPSSTTKLEDVFLATVTEQMKTAINNPAPLTLLNYIDISQPGKKESWNKCLNALLRNKTFKTLSHEVPLHATVYKIQLKIKALLDFRNKKTNTEITEESFDPVKIKILALIDARIEKIDSTLGVFKGKSPEKIKAWLSLYEKLYLEPEMTAFVSIINAWEGETQTINGNEVTNGVIIKNQRSKFKLFETDESTSYTILGDIRKLLPSGEKNDYGNGSVVSVCIDTSSPT